MRESHDRRSAWLTRSTSCPSHPFIRDEAYWKRNEGIADYEPEIIKSAIAMTLRSVSLWVESDTDRNELSQIAKAVDDLDFSLSRDDLSWLCCPLCEEMTCDAGCPLSLVRPDPSAF